MIPCTHNSILFHNLWESVCPHADNYDDTVSITYFIIIIISLLTTHHINLKWGVVNIIIIVHLWVLSCSLHIQTIVLRYHHRNLHQNMHFLTNCPIQSINASRDGEVVLVCWSNHPLNSSLDASWSIALYNLWYHVLIVQIVQRIIRVTWHITS